MSSAWFGDEWPSSMLPDVLGVDLAQHSEVPIGIPCTWCREEIVATDHGLWIAILITLDDPQIHPVHTECRFRSIVGGLAHLEERCLCYGGTVEDSAHPGMTDREEAIAVWRRFHRITQ